MERLSRYLVFGLTAVLVLVAVTFLLVRQLTVTSATGGGPEMLLNVTSPADACDDADRPTKCTIAEGAAFTLSVEAPNAPAGGYIGIQTFIDYGSDLVYTKGGTADEIVWQDLNESVALRGQTASGLVNHAGLTGLIPPLPVSEYTGTVVELAFNCSAASSQTTVDLLAYSGPGANQVVPPGTDGTGFAVSISETTVAKVSPLTINCGEGAPEPTDTPTPTATTEGPTPTVTDTPTEGPTPTVTDTPTEGPPTATEAPPTATSPATSTPTPTETPETILGDVNCDRTVDSTDALWVLWIEAELSDLGDVDCPDAADMNGDGTIDSVDALFILWIELGEWP